MGFKDYIINLSLVGMFVLAVATFSINFANENNSTSITNDSATLISINTLTGALNSFAPNVTTAQNAYSNSTPTIDFNGLTFFSLPGVIKNLVVAPFAFFNTIFKMVFGTFFGDTTSNVLSGVIIALVIVISILYGYKWLRSGDPD